MICILHGYLLDGSGSNLWTRSMVRALCRAGHDVQLVCQEYRPQDHDFIAAAYAYEPDGSVTTLVERETPYAGRCVMHKPRLGDTLPVYVGDKYEEFARVVPMIDLTDAEIEAYVAVNAAVVARVVREHGVTAIHANHAVLMPVVARRVARETGTPYAVMPHGSAIEYAVKKDKRFHALAADALEEARRVIVVGEEMRWRVTETFGDVAGIGGKLREVPLGVDTDAFAPVAQEDRDGEIARLRDLLVPLERGRGPDTARRLRAGLRPDMPRDDLLSVLDDARTESDMRPDVGLEDSLAAIDWRRDDVLLFVGRMIAGKGLHSLIAALPDILTARPRARLIVVGHGPQRAVMEALLWALENGATALARNIARWGAALEHGADAPYDTLGAYFASLEKDGTLKRYFDTARRTLRSDRVLFTGYLTHTELRHLFPCADAAVFPSVVAEAGPLVFLEALASGCFPLGVDKAGMGASIDAAAHALPPQYGAVMRLSADPTYTVRDIAANVPKALVLEGRHAPALRRAVVKRHDWRRVADQLAAELTAMADDGATNEGASDGL